VGEPSGRAAHRDGGEGEAGRERSRLPGPEPEPADGEPRVRAADGGSEGGAVEEAEERERDDGRREEGRVRAPAQNAATPAGSAAMRRRRHRPPAPRSLAPPRRVSLYWPGGVGMRPCGATARGWASPRGRGRGRERTGEAVAAWETKCERRIGGGGSRLAGGAAAASRQGKGTGRGPRSRILLRSSSFFKKG
jgi:hypothetical protein